MTDEPRIRHKNFMIELKSFRSDGLWVPSATVSGPEIEREGARVVRGLGDPSPTQEGANAKAKKLAIEWIDSQFPSAVD